LSNKQELSVDNISQFDSPKIHASHSTRRALSSFYASYRERPQRFFYQPSLEPLEIITSFYNSVNAENSSKEIYDKLHSAAIKIGYNYTAICFPNGESSELDITLKDFTGKTYNQKQSLDETENVLVKTFEDKKIKHLNSLHLPEISHVSDNQCIIIPLVHQNESQGVFVAGTTLINNRSHEIMIALCAYATMLIANSNLRDKLYYNNGVDSLTGLVNHKEFQEKLSEQLKKAEKAEKQLSVILFDINNIAKINKELGHAKGDEIISFVSSKIKENIRAKDIAGRFGGDEIAVILPGADNTKACYVAKHINNCISRGCIEKIGHIKVSTGVATYPECAKEQEKLLILVEQAMLVSKHESYKNGSPAVISAQDMDFWNKIALNTLARVIAKRHSKWGMSFEDELVKKFLKSKKMPKIPLDVVSSLAGAIDAKDTYTRGHSQAVSIYSEALARAINLPEKTVQRIKLAALLHDVGKIGITESVLRKPGALTDHEWEIMKQHPVIGAKKVLEPVKSLKDLIPIVKHHHERVDGLGYPDRLKDDEIPLGAKIVSIADAFHALISNRPYRKALSLEKAIEILNSGAGTQWDKELISKFVVIAPSLYQND